MTAFEDGLLVSPIIATLTWDQRNVEENSSRNAAILVLSISNLSCNTAQRMNGMLARLQRPAYITLVFLGCPVLIWRLFYKVPIGMSRSFCEMQD
jgi:hypothetical protein